MCLLLEKLQEWGAVVELCGESRVGLAEQDFQESF